MERPKPQNLRARLRTDTQSSHAALDALVSGFDLATSKGLAGFMAMQAGALSKLAPLVEHAQCEALIRHLRDLVARDLVTLKTRAVRVEPKWASTPHQVAIDYVIIGSRLGTQVLQKRWAASTDAQAQAADAYFSAPSFVELWRQFCDRNTGLPAIGPYADRIVSDANQVFDFYHACAVAAQHETGTVDA
ncbi:MAG: biliverdin-producing heme oxygenase [Arenibacterium sp.]